MWQFLLSKCVSDPIVSYNKYANPLYELKGPEVSSVHIGLEAALKQAELNHHLYERDGGLPSVHWPAAMQTQQQQQQQPEITPATPEGYVIDIHPPSFSFTPAPCEAHHLLPGAQAAAQQAQGYVQLLEQHVAAAHNTVTTKCARLASLKAALTSARPAAATNTTAMRREVLALDRETTAAAEQLQHLKQSLTAAQVEASRRHAEAQQLAQAVHCPPQLLPYSSLTAAGPQQRQPPAWMAAPQQKEISNRLVAPSHPSAVATGSSSTPDQATAATPLNSVTLPAAADAAPRPDQVCPSPKLAAQALAAATTAAAAGKTSNGCSMSAAADDTSARPAADQLLPPAASAQHDSSSEARSLTALGTNPTDSTNSSAPYANQHCGIYRTPSGRLSEHGEMLVNSESSVSAGAAPRSTNSSAGSGGGDKPVAFFISNGSWAAPKPRSSSGSAAPRVPQRSASTPGSNAGSSSAGSNSASSISAGSNAAWASDNSGESSGGSVRQSHFIVRSSSLGAPAGSAVNTNIKKEGTAVGTNSMNVPASTGQRKTWSGRPAAVNSSSSSGSGSKTKVAVSSAGTAAAPPAAGPLASALAGRSAAAAARTGISSPGSQVRASSAPVGGNPAAGSNMKPPGGFSINNSRPRPNSTGGSKVPFAAAGAGGAAVVMPLVLAPAARGGNSRYSSAGGQGASCSSSSDSSHSSGDSLASSSSSSRRQPGDLAQDIARLQAMHNDVMAELKVFKSG